MFLFKLFLCTYYIFSSDVYSQLRQNANDENENDIRALKTELLVASSESRALEQLLSLIRQHRGTAMEPTLRFRLAELYMRMSRTDRFFEVNRDSETIVRLVPQLAKNASERNNILKAIEAYDLIERRFSDFRDMDLVLFNSAFARQQVQRNNQAKTLYLKLISSYPKSPLIPDSYLALGEMEFEKHSFREASKFFEKIKKYPDSTVYPYARYKLGWSYFNLTMNREALAELEAVVEYGRKNEYSRSSRRLDLRREALGDMVLFYADFMPADNALNYFVKWAGEEEAGEFLLSLANLYNRHGKKQEQIIVLNLIIRTLNRSPFLPLAYVALAEVYESDRKRDEVVKVLASFHKLCDPKSTYMQSATKVQFTDSDIDHRRLDCQANFDALSVQLAQKWDKFSRRNPTDEMTYKAAVSAYDFYLSRAEGKQNHVPMQYALSELLFTKEDYARASKEYFKTAQLTDDKKILHDSSYASIVSLERAVADKWTKASEAEYVRLAAFYITSNPKGEFIEDVEFKRAFIIYDSGRFAEAAPILKDLGERYATKSQGIKAQDLYLDILNMNKDYKAISNYSNFLLGTIDNKINKDRHTKLTKIYQEASFLEIQEIEKSKNYEVAYKAYQDFAKNNLSSELAHKAWWNSLGILQKLNKKRDLANAAVIYANKFPKAENHREALLIAIQSYESIADLNSSIKVLDKLIHVDSSQSYRWLELKGDYQYLLGKYSDSNSTYEELIRRSNKEQRGQLLEKMAQIEKDRGNTARYEYYLDLIVKNGIEPSSSRAQVHFINKAFKNKSFPEAFRLASSVVGNSRADNVSKANARLIQAKILADEFYNQSVRSNHVERIAMVIALKTERLDKAQRAFQATIRYRDAETSVEALYETALLYGHYARAIRSIRLPAEISEQDAQVFYNEMENLAIPMEEKEVDTLQEAFKNAAKLNMYNGLAGKIKQKLDEVNHVKTRDYHFNISPSEILLPRPSGA